MHMLQQRAIVRNAIANGGMHVWAQVISVGAIKPANLSRADFSTYNPFVQLSAPGDFVLSTITKPDIYRMDQGIQVSTKPALTSTSLSMPAPQAVDGSSYGTVTAPLVDCGTGGAATCAGAKGKICLIQSGTSPEQTGWQRLFCPLASACQRGGGIAAIVYNNEGAGQCDVVRKGDLIFDCDEAFKPIPTAALTLQQGRAVKALIAASKGAATATVTVPDPVVNAKRVRGWLAWPVPELPCVQVAPAAAISSVRTDLPAACRPRRTGLHPAPAWPRPSWRAWRASSGPRTRSAPTCRSGTRWPGRRATWGPRGATSSLATAWCRRRLRWTTWPSGAARAHRCASSRQAR
jgi:hypothetical protein